MDLSAGTVLVTGANRGFGQATRYSYARRTPALPQIAARTLHTG